MKKQFKFFALLCFGILAIAGILSGFLLPSAGVAMAAAPALVSGGDLEAIKASLTANKAWGRMKNQVLAPAFLRMETAIATNTGTFSFFISKQGNENVCEVKLNRNDRFFATALGMFLKRTTTSGGTVRHANQVLQTYPNPSIFVASGTFDPILMESFYNGYITVQVNQTVWIDSYDTHRFRYVPTAQQGTITAADYDSATPAENTHALAGSGYEGQGYSRLPQTLVLDGANQIDITLTIPTDPTQVIVNPNTGQQNWIVLIPKGVIAKGINA